MNGITPLLVTGDVTAAAGGDVRAFERLVEATKRVVTSITVAVTRDVATSEDIAQDVFVQAWKDLPTLKNAESFLPWIRQLARHKAFDAMRGKRRSVKWETKSFVEGSTEESSALDRALEEEEHLVLAEAIEALPDDTREVLTLFYREDSSVKHVAELLGLSEDAVKKRLERARIALRKELLERFETIAKRTAPSAALTAAIITAITFGAPTTAAAATAAGTTALKGVFGVSIAGFLGPAIGLFAGIFGIAIGMRKQIADAIDDDERRALVRYRNRLSVATTGFTLGLMLLGYTGSHHLVPSVALAAMTLLLSVGYMAGAGYASQVILPRILARRTELERLRDPEGFARKEKRDKRRRKLAFLAGMTFAAFGVVVGVYVALTQ